MLNSDEIVIEMARGQATTANGNAQWTQQIPDIILEEGDEIMCSGGWLAVKGGGDEAIEIFDLEDPSSPTIDASFYLSYFKSMDAKNVIAFPYTSQKFSETTYDWEQMMPLANHLVGFGFSKIPLNVHDIYTDTTKDIIYDGIPSTDYSTDAIYNPDGTGTATNIPITAVMRYDTIVHTADSDDGNSDLYSSYLNYLQNNAIDTTSSLTQHPQAYRDMANTNNKYTALYREATTERYKMIQRKVSIELPRGYYTPASLSEFISQEMNTKYFNKVVNGTLEETWVNCGRFFDTLKTISVPQIATTMGVYTFDDTGVWADPIGANINCPPSKSTPYPNIFLNTPSNIGFSTGLTFGMNQGLVIYDVLPRDPASAISDMSITDSQYIYCSYGCRNAIEQTKFAYTMTMCNYVTSLYNAKGFPESAHQKSVDTGGRDFWITWMMCWGSEYNTYGDLTANPPPTYTGPPTIWRGIMSNLDDDNPKADVRWSNGKMTYVSPEEGGGDFGTFYFTLAATDQATQISDPLNQLNPPALMMSYPMSGVTNNGLTPGNTDWWLTQFPYQVKTEQLDLFISVGGNLQIATFDDGNPASPTKINPTTIFALAMKNGKIPTGLPLYIGDPQYYSTWTNQLGTNAIAPAGSREPGNPACWPNYAESMVSGDTPYAWSCIRNFSDSTYNGGSEKWTFPTDHINMDYASGNRYMGGSYGNWNRWSLMNHEEPPVVEDEDDPYLMPILRKYPNFTQQGCNMCVGSDSSTTDISEKYMWRIDNNGSEDWTQLFNTFTFYDMTKPDYGLNQRGNIATPQKFLEPFDIGLHGEPAYFNLEDGNYPNTDNPKDLELYINPSIDNMVLFIQAQIDDGMIKDPEIYDNSLIWEETTNFGRPYFLAYFHMSMETLTNNVPLSTTDYKYNQMIPQTKMLTCGSDESLRNRGRGILVIIDFDSWKNYKNEWFVVKEYKNDLTGILLPLYSTDDAVVNNTPVAWRGGFPLVPYYSATAGSEYILTTTSFHLYSWIYDRVGCNDTIPDSVGNAAYNYKSNFGFCDYNLCVSAEDRVLLTGSWSELVDDQRTRYGDAKMGIGYAYTKTAWRNFTAMLTSYSLEEATASNVFWNGQGNRMVEGQELDVGGYTAQQDGQPPYQTYGDINIIPPIEVSSSEFASLKTTNRVWLGARDAGLFFSTDESSRFFWSNFYTPTQLTNPYSVTNNSNNEGFYPQTAGYAVDTGDLVSTIQQPYIDPYADVSTGYSISVPALPADASTTPPSGNAPQYAQDNTNLEGDEAGTDVIQYYVTKNNVFNDSLFQLAPDPFKFDYFLTGANDATYSTGTAIYEQNFITGNQFFQMFPVNTNMVQKFFCYDQDVRRNTWAAGTSERVHDITADGKPNDIENNPNVMSYPDNPGDPTQESTDYNYMQYRFTPTCYWGTYPGDYGFKEQTSEAGTCRPNPKVIYDTQAGIQIYDWGKYDKTNWDKSIWKIMGFDYSDIRPTQRLYQGQTRNFTTNLLQPTDPNFPTESYPLRTDAALTSTGFVSINSNIEGQLQYLLQYPRQDFVSDVGVIGLQNLTRWAGSCLGGVVNGQGRGHFPYGSNGAIDYEVDITYNIGSPAWTLEQSLNLVDYIQGGGGSIVNGTIYPNQFNIQAGSDLSNFGTKRYATELASKLESPFFLIRSDIVENNWCYTNNAESPAIMPVVACIGKQFGATNDWNYSTDQLNLVFTNKKKRVLNSVNISLTDNYGILAANLEPNSSIFFKIIRKDIDPDRPEYWDDDLGTDRERYEDFHLDKQTSDLLHEEVEGLLNQEAIND